MKMQGTQESKQPNYFAKWIKRFGIAGFLFFLIKGIVVWLIIPALIAYLAF